MNSYIWPFKLMALKFLNLSHQCLLKCMIKISASILILRIVLLAKFAKLKCTRFTVIWNPQMVQDPTFSLCDRITQTGGRTCLLLRSGFSSRMLALVGLGCLFIAGSGSSSLLISCVNCDEVLFFCKNKKKKKKKKKKPWTLHKNTKLR